MTEKLTRLVNRDEADDVVYSHHGSLSREVRSVVEERLKAGRLAGIVATSSLELGIDIGTLDEVVMVQTPPAVSSALHRYSPSGRRSHLTSPFPIQFSESERTRCVPTRHTNERSL